MIPRKYYLPIILVITIGFVLTAMRPQHPYLIALWMLCYVVPLVAASAFCGYVCGRRVPPKGKGSEKGMAVVGYLFALLVCGALVWQLSNWRNGFWELFIVVTCSLWLTMYIAGTLARLTS